ncbi:MAG: hypothetical protein ACKOJ7_00850 [Betaproteobacteria bacterium]
MTAHDRRLALSQCGVLQRFTASLFGLGLCPLAFLVHPRLRGLGLGLRACIRGLQGHATRAGLVGVEHRTGPIGRGCAAKHGGAGLGRGIAGAHGDCRNSRTCCTRRQGTGHGTGQ